MGEEADKLHGERQREENETKPNNKIGAGKEEEWKEAIGGEYVPRSGYYAAGFFRNTIEWRDPVVRLGVRLY